MANYIQKQISFIQQNPIHKWESFDWWKQNKIYDSFGINICYAGSRQHPRHVQPYPLHVPLVSQLKFASLEIFITGLRLSDGQNFFSILIL